MMIRLRQAVTIGFAIVVSHLGASGQTGPEVPDSPRHLSAQHKPRDARAVQPRRSGNNAQPKTKLPTAARNDRDELDDILAAHVKWLQSIGAGGLTTLRSLTEVARQPVAAGAWVSGSVLCQTGSTVTKIEWKVELGKSLYDAIHDFDVARRKAGCPADGRQARLVDISNLDLHGKDLRLADLSQSDIEESNLQGVNLSGASLEKAYIINHSDLRNAILFGTDFKNVKIWDSNLSGADARYADLSAAEILRSDLTSANFDFSNLAETHFEPSAVTGLSIFGAQGLATLQFFYPKSIVALRKASGDAGMQREARAFTSAIKKNELRTAPISTRVFDEYLLGGALTDFGVNPWRPVGMLFALIPAFALIYCVSLVVERQTNIWVLHYTDVPVEKNQKAVRVRPRRMTPTALREHPGALVWNIFGRLFYALRVGLYFSCVSAFRIGWKDFNIGDWIARLQMRSYALKATGWIRTVSGFQSLLSLYLLVIWALSYFGSPFER